MRMIDADALGMDMWIQMGIVYGEDIGKAFADIVRNAPTIDAVPTDFADRCMQIEIDKRINMCEACERVEVVRCKECKHGTEKDGGIICDQNIWDKNDYCSYGERREDGSD